MAKTHSASFAALLKRYRAARGLTQEELAERARLSARAISDLERGVNHRPQAYTIQRLVQALDLNEVKAASFQRAARGMGEAAAALGESAEVVRDRISLPIQPTPFIGRQREVEEVRTLLGRDEVRLLTLTGPGGVGKTRLAVRIAEEVAPRFSDGVVFVSLASLADPGLVPATLAGALGVREGGGQPILEALLDRLRPKRVLLVLDNFEHLLPAADVVSNLLVLCPQLAILVTSRAILHLAAEHEYPVPPLPVPTPLHLPELDAISRYGAVQLFVQRAQAVKPEFRLAEGNAAAVAEICCRLDGLPLAIELAAARVRVLPVPALLARLEHRLRILTGGPRDLPQRQQTMRDTIAWSYSLLFPEQQTLLARLSVFAGGWSFAAMKEVCTEEGDLDSLEGLTSLVEQSLVRQEGEEEPRFRMLESIGEYAAEKLAERGEADEIRQAHARFFLRLAVEAEPQLRGPGQKLWGDRMEAEHDNLRAALGWLLAHGQFDEELRMAVALRAFWEHHWHLSEKVRWLQPGLEQVNGVAEERRAAALNSLGDWSRGQGDLDRATALQEEALALFTKLEDRKGKATVLENLAGTAWQQGDYGRALRRAEEALASFREMGDSQGTTSALSTLGTIQLSLGDYALARIRLEEALAIQRSEGSPEYVSMTLCCLGAGALQQGLLDEAEARFKEAFALAQEMGGKSNLAWILLGLGQLALMRQSYGQAADYLLDSLRLSSELRYHRVILGVLDDYRVILSVLDAMARMAVETGKPERAARLAGAEAAIREAIGAPVEPADRDDHARIVERIRQALREDDYRRAWKAGRTMNLADTVSYAFGERE